MATPVKRRTRRTGDAVCLAVGLVVLLLSAIPVEGGHVPALEVDVFRAINDLPGFFYPVVYPLMQLGNVVVVPVVSVLALVIRRVRLAATLFVAGMGSWLVPKLIKRVVERGRPDELLPDVHIHGDPAAGLGFVSGHIAITVALAVVAAPFLGPRWRWVGFGLAAVVGVARVYVGAHLPLDMTGGAGVGLALGSAALLIFGVPQRYGRPAVTDGPPGWRPRRSRTSPPAGS